MNKTSLIYFLLAALCLCLMLVSCNSAKKRIKSFTSDGCITDTIGNIKLGGTGLVNTTIDTTAWTDATKATRLPSFKITPIKHDTIYTYRDTCVNEDELPDWGTSVLYFYSDGWVMPDTSFIVGEQIYRIYDTTAWITDIRTDTLIRKVLYFDFIMLPELGDKEKIIAGRSAKGKWYTDNVQKALERFYKLYNEKTKIKK